MRSEIAFEYAELSAVSNFSFLEGGSHPEELVAQAKVLGLAAIAIADRNTLAGVVRAHVTAKSIGQRLIIGSRLELNDCLRLVCLPKDRSAYGRLCRLLSLGQGRAVKGQCHLNLADVAGHAHGQVLIILPPNDWMPNSLAPNKTLSSQFELDVGRIKASCEGASLYLAAACGYGGDDHAKLTVLAGIASRQGVPLVATNAVQFHDPNRRRLADVVACVRTGKTISEAGYMLASNAERHLKSPAAIAQLFKKYPQAVAATIEIVQSCTFSLDELVYEYPDEPVPSGITPNSYLAELTWAGAHERFPDGVPSRITQRVLSELSLIAQLNYSPYFLTVYDIVRFARSRGILCQGRGSAANSVVCYCLGITCVNPTEIDMLFERFITLERREPPDIDVDFEHERREEVIQYIYQRYGRDKAGLAATVICYRARSAVRDVGKVLGLSEDTISALAGIVWGTRSGGSLPEKYVREAGLDPTDPLLATVLELADELIGFPRHLSQHVGGFVLTRGPLIEVVPVGNGAMQDRTFIEWDKTDLAALGLLKVDVLALGMLTCVHRAFDLIKAHYGRDLTLANIPREDPAVYAMLCRADSLGVFQVESRAQMNMLPRLKPVTFYDLVIEVAIVRPGPIQGDMVHPYLRRRSGLEPEIYPSPSPEHGDANELRNILGKTKGVPLFQEQAMRIAMDAAKFTDAEVNELRKAMATFRKRGTIGLLEEKMVLRMVARGYDPVFAARCFNQIKGFGEYGFPESHAASFALLVYVSSWLKCHYPEVFACALLNSQPMGFYAPAQIVRDAREHDVTVHEVDVSRSHWDCTLEPISNDDSGFVRPTGGLAVRLGLRQVDGLIKTQAARIVEARQNHLKKVMDLDGKGRCNKSGAVTREPFASVADFATVSGITRGTLDKLAAADAFRSLQRDRREALWDAQGLSHEETLPLFAWGNTQDRGSDPDVALPPMQLSEHVVADYQTLRLSLKAHPLTFLRDKLDTYSGGRVVSARQLANVKDGARICVAGVVLVRQRPGSAKGVVFMTLEDETGVANVIVWPKTLERYRSVVMGARLILVHGRVQRQESIIHLVSERLEDRSDWLGLLADGARLLKIPLAPADEVARPGADRSAKESVQPRAIHPRNERIIPKSRDFH